MRMPFSKHENNKILHAQKQFSVLSSMLQCNRHEKHCNLQNCLIKQQQFMQQYLLPETSISKILRLVQSILYYEISWFVVGTSGNHVMIRPYSHGMPAESTSHYMTAESTKNEDFRGTVTRRVIGCIKRVTEPTFIDVIKNNWIVFYSRQI